MTTKIHPALFAFALLPLVSAAGAFTDFSVDFFGLPADKAFVADIVTSRVKERTEHSHRGKTFKLALAIDDSLPGETRRVCERLFAYRKKQPWPPTIVKGDGWEDLYLSAKGELQVLPTVDDAIAWATELIGKIENRA